MSIITVDYDLPRSVRRGCNFIQEGGTATKCPLKAGDQIIYLFQQEVDKDAMTIFSPDLTFRIYDKLNRVIACYMWTANIV